MTNPCHIELILTEGEETFPGRNLVLLMASSLLASLMRQQRFHRVRGRDHRCPHRTRIQAVDATPAARQRLRQRHRVLARDYPTGAIAHSDRRCRPPHDPQAGRGRTRIASVDVSESGDSTVSARNWMPARNSMSARNWGAFVAKPQPARSDSESTSG